jgi:hypothetical protein
MPNDAKLGLVVGVGLVILVAVLFFGKELVPEHAAASPAVAVATPPAEEKPAEERPLAQTASHVKLLESGVLPAVNEDVVKKEE